LPGHDRRLKRIHQIKRQKIHRLTNKKPLRENETVEAISRQADNVASLIAYALE